MNLEVKINSPFDPALLKDMIKDRGDMALVYPKASFPFVHDEWVIPMTLHPLNKSFIFYSQGRPVGHAGLLHKGQGQSDTLWIVWVYLSPQLRGIGLGRKMLEELEKQACQIGAITRLALNVRAFNLEAMSLYKAMGYSEFNREGDLLQLEKHLYLS